MENSNTGGNTIQIASKAYFDTDVDTVQAVIDLPQYFNDASKANVQVETFEIGGKWYLTFKTKISHTS